MFRVITKAFVCCATIALLPAGIYGSIINVDFGSAFGPPSSSYGAASGEAGAWNSVTAAGTTNNLADLSDNLTSISVTVSADSFAGVWGSDGSNTALLRADNFFSAGDNWSVSFTNLDDGTYNLYYYAPENGVVSTGDFTANGVAVAGIHSTTGASTLNEGSDWEVITGITVTNGTLTMFDNTNTNSSEGLAGLQLVQTPEPSSMLLVAAGLLLPFAKHRRS